MKRFSMYVAFVFGCSQAHAGQTYYQDIPKGQSPFQGSGAATQNTGNAQQQSNLYNSGLYKDAPKVNTGTPSSSGVGTASSPGGATGSKTFYDSAGIEYDSETGISTGRIDESQATKSTGTGGSSSSSSEADTAAAAKDPSENVPTGYVESATTATSLVASIRKLVTDAPSQNAIFNPVGLPEIEAGEKAYSSGQKTCTESQASASNWCRDDTNPELQSTMMIVNALTAGANSLAVNDSCNNFSKAMTLAQAGMTAYTVSCGAMKLKCDTTCGGTLKGLTTMQAGLAKEAACVPANLSLPDGCANIRAQFETYRSQLVTIVKKEMVPTDRIAVAGKAKLCKVAYAGLLASAAVSLVSIAKSIKDGKKCDEDSDGSGTSNVASESSTSSTGTADTPASSSEVAGGTTTVGNTTPSAGTSTPEVVGFPTDGVTTTPSNSSDSSIRKMSAASPYADYLPGGSKDPTREVASESAAWKKEVTSAGGKSNWLKTKERFREFEAIP